MMFHYQLHERLSNFHLAVPASFLSLQIQYQRNDDDSFPGWVQEIIYISKVSVFSVYHQVTSFCLVSHEQWTEMQSLGTRVKWKDGTSYA